jgi:hypothetical protein
MIHLNHQTHIASDEALGSTILLTRAMLEFNPDIPPPTLMVSDSTTAGKEEAIDA